MTLVLEVSLRSSVPIAVALLAAVLLRHRSAALRHAVLTAGLAAAFAVVPLSHVLPPWTVVLPTDVTPALQHASSALAANVSGVPHAQPALGSEPLRHGSPDVVQASAVSQMTGSRFQQVLWIVWLAGVALGAGMLLLGLVRLVSISRRAEPVVEGPWRRIASDLARRAGVRRPITLLATRGSDVLATWGVFRPRVLLPAQAHTWNEECAHVALSHELAHIRRGDWPVQIAADVLRAVFWFNPLLWVLTGLLRRESEHACDDAVLGSGVPPATYASQLLEIARSCRRPSSPWVPAMPVARASTLEGRITAMLDTRLNRRAPTRRARALIVAALAAVAASIASFGVSAQDIGGGALTGYVYDNTGGVLPGVEVVLTDERNERRRAVSDGTGQFRFQNAGAGKYVLEATLGGFRTFRNEFDLAVPQNWTRNITMQVGELEETIKVTGKRPAKTVPLRAGINANKPVRVGGSIKVPTKVKDVPPIYPAEMQAAGLEGIVPMDAIIGVDGRVVSVRVLSAEVHPALARAAEEAVRQWAFTPTLLNNTAVEVEMTVSVEFRLEE